MAVTSVRRNTYIRIAIGLNTRNFKSDNWNFLYQKRCRRGPARTEISAQVLFPKSAIPPKTWHEFYNLREGDFSWFFMRVCMFVVWNSTLQCYNIFGNICAAFLSSINFLNSLAHNAKHPAKNRVIEKGIRWGAPRQTLP